MDSKGREIDRRTFMKSTLAVGAGLAMTSSMGNVAWGKSSAAEDLADLSLYQLSKMILKG